MPKVYAAEPSAFQPKEIDDFVAFVIAGGEVAARGLRDRVMRAPHIAFLRENDCLLGVGGLKSPSNDYRKGIEASSTTRLPGNEFPFELGWIFILPSARDRKLSFPLSQPLVAAAKGSGVFATSRTSKGNMHSTLKKLGFVRAGSEWPSKENDGKLALFLRHAA